MDVLDREYLDWLKERIEKYTTIYCFPGMSEDKNVFLIEELFNRIDEYVKENYYFDVDEYGSKYSFRDLDNKYTIYKNDHGPEIVYSVQRANDRPSYIDLDDVKKRVVRGKENLEVLYRMRTISIYLRELEKMGVPMNVVETATKREFKLIRENKKRTY